ncbi:transposase, partial [Micromonospora sp. MS34]|uniref:transposase n=1 Tax=Micromonospora sp. MS34 TaxID=3385971 RepID=UPI0039A093DE
VPAACDTRSSAVSQDDTSPKAILGRVRLFKLAKASATKTRTQAINQLKAILVGADPTLRDSLTGLSNPKLVRRCAELDPGQPDNTASAAAYTLRLLARQIIELTREADDLNQRITDAINDHTPELLQRHGVGPDTAAALLLAAGDNPQRLTSEASFAALCGASPIEMSSGKTQRRRAQPRRRPPSELRPLHHCHRPTSLGRPHSRLHRPARLRGQNPTRSDPLPQTLRCQGTLRTHRPDNEPQAAPNRLTSIGASNAPSASKPPSPSPSSTSGSEPYEKHG